MSLANEVELKAVEQVMGPSSDDLKEKEKASR